MRRYGMTVVSHPWLVIGFLAAISALVLSHLPDLHWELRMADILPQNHPNTQIAARIRDLFGVEKTAVIALHARQGDIFTTDLLGRIVRMTQSLEEVPGVVRPSVLSLASPRVTWIHTDGDRIEVQPVLPKALEDAGALQHFRAKLLADPLYRDLIVSADGSAALIIADFSDTVTNASIYEHLSELAERFRDEHMDVVLSGVPILAWRLEAYSRRAGWIFPVTLLVVALIHYEAFRTVQAMALPLVTALLSLLLSLGLMAWLGYPLDPWNAVTPIIILAIAAGHAVQMLKRYYEEFELSGDTRLAVVESLVGVGPVMLTAGGIAVAGFCSLMTFGVRSVRVFGLLLACGVAATLLVEFTLIPAWRSLLSPPRRERDSGEAHSSVKALAAAIGGQVVRAPRRVLAASLLIIATIGAGVFQVPVNNSYRDWFYPGSQPRLDDDFINQHFGGTNTLNLLVEGHGPGSLEEPAVVAAVADLQTFMRALPDVGKVVSYVDFLFPIHRAFAPDRSQLDPLPPSRNLIAQYLMLYETSASPEALRSLLDSTHQWALVTAFTRSDEAKAGRSLMELVRDFTIRRFERLPARVQIAAGSLGLQTAMNDDVVREKLWNVAQVSGIITILSILVLRSITGGLLVLAPLAVSVIVNLGLMGWLSIPLSMATAAITAMGVSIGADFAIYLLYRIREERKRVSSLPEAVRRCFTTAGEAICFVSSAIVGGYLTLTLAGFRTWAQVGSLTALMITASSLATLTLVPALILIVRPRFIEPPTAGGLESTYNPRLQKVER